MAKGFVIWLTGLSGAGKSTIAGRLVQELTVLGRHVEVLDGDEVRTHLSKGLGFSKEDRDTNIRRIGYVAGLVARSGGVAITAAISPYREIRDEVRERTPNFVEVYVRCSIEELTRRDVKGLYAKALAGELPHFTGISDPYEEPLHPEIVVDSGRESVEESTERILDRLEVLGHISRGVRERLASGAELEQLQEQARTLPSLDLDPARRRMPACWRSVPWHPCTDSWARPTTPRCWPEGAFRAASRSPSRSSSGSTTSPWSGCAERPGWHCARREGRSPSWTSPTSTAPIRGGRHRASTGPTTRLTRGCGCSGPRVRGRSAAR